MLLPLSILCLYKNRDVVQVFGWNIIHFSCLTTLDRRNFIYQGKTAGRQPKRKDRRWNSFTQSVCCSNKVSQLFCTRYTLLFSTSAYAPLRKTASLVKGTRGTVLNCKLNRLSTGGSELYYRMDSLCQNVCYWWKTKCDLEVMNIVSDLILVTMSEVIKITWKQGSKAQDFSGLFSISPKMGSKCFQNASKPCLTSTWVLDEHVFSTDLQCKDNWRAEIITSKRVLTATF